jgi:hypothetical protein
VGASVDTVDFRVLEEYEVIAHVRDSTIRHYNDTRSEIDQGVDPVPSRVSTYVS